MIYGRRLQSLPEVTEEEDESESTCTRRYKYLNQKLQHFWKRWQREYLTDLRESHRKQGSSNRKSPKVGDLVSVYNEDTKRGSWKLTVVERLILGKDKEVRGANVRVITKGKIVRLSRPVQKLFPIEIRAQTSEIPAGPKECAIGPRSRDVPRRSAALDAAWKTRAMISQPND